MRVQAHINCADINCMECGCDGTELGEVAIFEIVLGYSIDECSVYICGKCLHDINNTATKALYELQREEIRREIK